MPARAGRFLVSALEGAGPEVNDRRRVSRQTLRFGAPLAEDLGRGSYRAVCQRSASSVEGSSQPLTRAEFERRLLEQGHIYRRLRYGRRGRRTQALLNQHLTRIRSPPLLAQVTRPVSHIPIAFYLLGVFAALYVLAVTLEAKARDSRMRPRRPGPESHGPTNKQAAGEFVAHNGGRRMSR